MSLLFVFVARKSLLKLLVNNKPVNRNQCIHTRSDDARTTRLLLVTFSVLWDNIMGTPILAFIVGGRGHHWRARAGGLAFSESVVAALSIQ
jgi:hypothetical protein